MQYTVKSFLFCMKIIFCCLYYLISSYWIQLKWDRRKLVRFETYNTKLNKYFNQLSSSSLVIVFFAENFAFKSFRKGGCTFSKNKAVRLLGTWIFIFYNICDNIFISTISTTLLYYNSFPRFLWKMLYVLSKDLRTDVGCTAFKNE